MDAHDSADARHAPVEAVFDATVAIRSTAYVRQPTDRYRRRDRHDDRIRGRRANEDPPAEPLPQGGVDDLPS